MRNAAARATGIAFIVASALAFGAMAILARVAYADGVDTATLLALRFAIAAVCLAVIARARDVTLPRGRDLASVAALGGAGYGGQAATFFTALTLAPAGLVALLLYLHPALVAVLAVAVPSRADERREARRAGRRARRDDADGRTGAERQRRPSAFPRLPLGIALGLAAAAIYSVYIIVGDAAHRACRAAGVVDGRRRERGRSLRSSPP